MPCRVVTGGYKETKFRSVCKGVGVAHSACLAARVSGGLKSHSARGHGSISESGGNASLAEAGERYGEP